MSGTTCSSQSGTDCTHPSCTKCGARMQCNVDGEIIHAHLGREECPADVRLSVTVYDDGGQRSGHFQCTELQLSDLDVPMGWKVKTRRLK
jgi:hypothetical protein